MERVERLIEHAPENIKGQIVKEHVILDIIGEDVHFWSPQLNFRIEEDEYNAESSLVSGLIGPRPNVWTMFMFIYFGIGLIGLIVSMIGFSKLMIGEFSHLVWALPLAIIFMLTAYIAGKFGEKLGEEQIELLKQFVRDAIHTDDLKVE